MTSQPIEPKPKRTKRAIVWFLVVAVIAIIVNFLASPTDNETAVLNKALGEVNRASEMLSSISPSSGLSTGTLQHLAGDLSDLRGGLKTTAPGKTRHEVDSLLEISLDTLNGLIATSLANHRVDAATLDDIRARLKSADSALVDLRSGNASKDGVSGVTGMARSVRDVSSSTLRWVATLSWPLLVVAILGLLITTNSSAERFAALLEHFDTLAVGPFSGTVKKKVRRADEIVVQYMQDIGTKLDQIAAARGLDRKLANVCEELKSTVSVKFRSTAYIKAPVLPDYLYQLLEYWGIDDLEKKRGRTFSIYFGIIGRTWRLEKSQIEGFVPSNEEVLIKQWGMTKRQALQAGAGQQSFAAILVKRESGVSESIIYFDAKDRDAFGKDDGERT